MRRLMFILALFLKPLAAFSAAGFDVNDVSYLFPLDNKDQPYPLSTLAGGCGEATSDL